MIGYPHSQHGRSLLFSRERGYKASIIIVNLDTLEKKVILPSDSQKLATIDDVHSKLIKLRFQSQNKCFTCLFSRVGFKITLLSPLIVDVSSCIDYFV
jgi:hypothetical protein